MKNTTPFRVFILAFLLQVITTATSNAQGFNGTFGIGVNVGSALYAEKDAATVGGRYIATIPGISFSKYIGHKMTVSFTLSNAIGDSQNYFSSDLNLNYDLFNPEGKLRPYAIGGIGLVSLLDNGFTLNLGAGSTYWLTDSIGLNGQAFYKASVFGTEFQRSHIFASVGLVYTLELGTKKRLWE